MTIPSADLEGLLERATPGPWDVCQHLKGIEEDRACGCGYRGVIYGPDDDKAICQPGHEPAPPGQEGSEPGRYPRKTEIANAQLIALAPALASEVLRLKGFLAEVVKELEPFDPHLDEADVSAELYERIRATLQGEREG